MERAPWSIATLASRVNMAKLSSTLAALLSGDAS